MKIGPLPASRVTLCEFADPAEHFFVPFVAGVAEGLYQIVVSGDSSTIFR